MHEKHIEKGVSEPKSMRKGSFAKLVGVSPGRISQLIAEGLPTEPDGRIDVARGKLWIKENVSSARSAAQSQQSSQEEMPFAARSDVAAERARLAREQADNVALKNAILRREMVPASEVEKEWTSIIRQARAAILAVPARLRLALPDLTPADIDLVDMELRKALQELAHAK